MCGLFHQNFCSDIKSNQWQRQGWVKGVGKCPPPQKKKIVLFPLVCPQAFCEIKNMMGQLTVKSRKSGYFPVQSGENKLEKNLMLALPLKAMLNTDLLASLLQV